MPRIKRARSRCNKCKKLIAKCNCNESIVRAIKSGERISKND